jgi:hypothetical protein
MAAINVRAADPLPGSKEHFEQLGAEIMSRSASNVESTSFERRWITHFQVAALVIATVWEMLVTDPDPDDRLDKGALPEHLLWAILFLRTYREESILAGMCGSVNEDTFRKWSWRFVLKISELEFDVVSLLFVSLFFYYILAISNFYCHHLSFQIQWENRRIGERGRDCLISVDGVDCQTTKQGKSVKAFYSHKFKSSGLRYGVASCIQTGNIVHIDGPHPPGDWNDLMTFRKYVKPKLDQGERVEADDGYQADDPEFIVSASGIRYMETRGKKNVRRVIRNRHETINERLKQFHVLSERFHHDISKHSACFRACAVLTEISFHYDKHPFEVSDAMALVSY